MFVEYCRFKDTDGNEFVSCEIMEGVYGFYWQPGMPGCMPDGEAVGPFDSFKECKEDAIENLS